MEIFKKSSWTDVSWVSKKINIKEDGLRLIQIVKEADRSVEDLLDYRSMYTSNMPAGCNPDNGSRTSEEVPEPGASNARLEPRAGSSSRTSCYDESSASDSESCDDVRGQGARGKRRPGYEHKRRRTRTNTVGRSTPISNINIGDSDDEIIKQLGFDEELDLGLGRGSCFVLSSLLSQGLSKDELHLNLDVHLKMDVKLKDKWKLIPENSQLKTVQIRHQAMPHDHDNDLRHRRLKYAITRIQNAIPFDPNGKKADLIPNETIVVIVRIYWPFSRTCAPNNRYRLRDPRFSQEIVMLSTQTLDKLKDKIMCVADTVVPGECSDNPCHVPDHTAKDVYKSGFFFINDAFYNDFRHPDNIDYSEVVRQWAMERDTGVVGTHTMETTKMEDLTVALGYPYLYQHQGNCEHLLTISDVRLLHMSESRSSKDYPYVLHQSRLGMQMCFMCGKFAARWLTENNSRVPFNPCYFCDRCFFSFNYIDGKKVGSFKAYYFREPIFIA